MKFEWDEAKSDACFRSRGFDFAYAAFAFADPKRMIRLDTRFRYGETRYQVTGPCRGPFHGGAAPSGVRQPGRVPPARSCTCSVSRLCSDWMAFCDDSTKCPMSEPAARKP